MEIRPTPLAKIAESAGFIMSDVALISGLNESTLSRLWDDPNWLDRISGKSLQAIVGTVPRVGEYISSYSLMDRRTRLADNLTNHGLTVDRKAFQLLVSEHGVPEQYLSNALSVALPILEHDADRAAAWLVRFWGRDQDFALGYLMGTAGGLQLLTDTKPLIVAAIDMVERLGSKNNSFHAIVGQANLLHHLARAATDIPDVAGTVGMNRQSALSFRSSVMGRIIATNDLDAAIRYCRTLGKSSFLSIVEEWSFPTYTHDARATHDFSLPRALILRATAGEVLREIEAYNDAYLYYLTNACIPTILRRDPSFGGRLGDLKIQLRRRMELCDDLAPRSSCSALLKALERDLPQEEETPFDHNVW
jgi:hypothetical protein